MTTARLQRACMAPERFTRILRSNASYTNSPSPIDPWRTTTVAIGDPVESEEHFLVPGGRFLVTADPQFIAVWDLGSPDCAVFIEPVTLARVGIEVDKGRDGPTLSTQLSVCMISQSMIRAVVAVTVSSHIRYV